MKAFMTVIDNDGRIIEEISAPMNLCARFVHESGASVVSSELKDGFVDMTLRSTAEALDSFINKYQVS